MDNKITEKRVEYEKYLKSDIALWRYMSFDKFMNFIVTKEMWFTRINEFRDKYEGYLDKDNIWKYALFKFEGFNFSADYSDSNEMNQIADLEWGTDRYKEIKKGINNIYVSCWNQSEYESELMWLAYGRGNSVVVKTSGKAIIESLNSSDDYINNTFWFDFGQVNYINHNEKKYDGISRVEPAFWKRKRFESEKEVRIVAYRFKNIELDEYTLVPYLDDNLKETKGIKVDMKNLKFEVSINPYAEPWFTDLIIKLSETYDFDIRKSEQYER